MSLVTTAPSYVTGQVVTAAQLNALQDGIQAASATYAIAWTASTTNPTIGNGTLIGRWSQVGKSIAVRGVVNGGTTTTVGSGTYSLSLPTASLTSSEQAVPGDFYDGAAHYAAVGLIASGSSVINPFSTKGGTAGSVIGLNSASFSAGALAIILCDGEYEAA